MVHDAIAYAPYVSFRFLNLMALRLQAGEVPILPAKASGPAVSQNSNTLLPAGEL